MEEKGNYGLLPWLVAPLVAFVLLLIVGFALPSSDCGGEDVSGSPSEVIFLGLAGLAIVGTVGTGLLQLVEMGRDDRFGARDALAVVVTLGVVGLIAVTVAGGRGDAGESLATAGLIVAPVAVLLLVPPAFTGRDRQAVGALLPIYLFGAAWWYYVVAALGLAISDGAFC